MYCGIIRIFEVLDFCGVFFGPLTHKLAVFHLNKPFIKLIIHFNIFLLEKVI